MKKIYNILFWLICIVLISLICFFAYKTYEEYADNNKNTQIQNEISENVTIVEDIEYEDETHYDSSHEVNNNKKPNKNQPTYKEPTIKSSTFIFADFENLKKENKDTVAWLYVPNTEINYSVVQTTNNDYYLAHNFNNEKNKAGWIFGDYRSNFDKLNRNTVIYGHNQTTSSMFGDMKKLINTPGWFDKEENKYIYLATPTATYVFEVVSVYTTDDNKYIKHGLSNNDDFQNFIDYILEKNTISSLSKDVDISDKILTLSTCHSGKRLTVQSKLIRTKLILD